MVVTQKGSLRVDGKVWQKRMRSLQETDIHCDLYPTKCDNLKESLEMSCYRRCNNLFDKHNFLFYLQGARTNKMEKADILEMTVKHLRTVQRQQFEGRRIVLEFHVIKSQFLIRNRNKFEKKSRSIILKS